MKNCLDWHKGNLLATVVMVVWFGYCPAVAQPVQTVVSSKQVVVGEPFVVSVRVKDVSVKDVAFPTLAGNGAEVVRQWTKDSVDAQSTTWVVQNYTLMLFQPGEFRVPSLSVGVQKNSTSQTLRTSVVAIYAELLAVTQPDLTAEPLAAVAYTRHEWLPYAIGLAGLLMGGLGFILYRKRNRWVQKQTPNPRKRALQQLNEVKGNGISPMDKTYALHMSRILKDYLTARFGIAAHHLTVSEITHQLTRQGTDARKVTHAENLLQQLQFLIYHPATDSKSRPTTLIDELRHTIDLLDKP